jgi:hypothetical protein
MARATVLELAGHLSVTPGGPSGFSADVMTAQLRSIIVDLLLAAGTDRDEAIAALPHVHWETGGGGQSGRTGPRTVTVRPFGAPATETPAVESTRTESACPAIRTLSTESAPIPGSGDTVIVPAGTSTSRPSSAVTTAADTAADHACGRHAAG